MFIKNKTDDIISIGGGVSVYWEIYERRMNRYENDRKCTRVKTSDDLIIATYTSASQDENIHDAKALLLKIWDAIKSGKEYIEV